MARDIGDDLDALDAEPRPPVIERARADLAAGKPWIAVNRLQSHLAHDPFDAEARALLVDLHLEMGDAAAAGRVAIATERDDDAVREAIAAWRTLFERARGAESRRLRSQGLLNAEVVNALGPIGRARVAPLAEQAREELGPFDERSYHEADHSLVDRVVMTGCSLGCLGLIVVVAAGVIQVADWLGV